METNREKRVMDVNEYKKIKTELFIRWKKKPIHDGKPFIEDGIINPEIWFSEKEINTPKILFILKEAYGGTYSLTEELSQNGPWGAMWNRAAEWIYGISFVRKDFIPEYKKLSKAEANFYLNRAAVMNLRKSDGKKDSSDKKFAEYAKMDKDLLKEQFDLIDADIIIYGYTFDEAENIHGLSEEKRKNSNEHWYYKDKKGRIHIDYFHPANHYPALLQYYGIVSIYKKALNE